MKRSHLRWLGLAAGLVLISATRRAEAAEAELPHVANEAKPEAGNHHLRLAISPALVRTFQSRSISHDALALSVALVPTRRFAVGLYGAYFTPFDRDRLEYAGTRPLSQSAGAISAEVKGTVLAGHEQGRGGELYVLGGTGVVVSRPVAVVDPAHRKFEHAAKLAWSGGVGGRFFFLTGMAAFVEVRATMYIDKEENRQVFAPMPSDPSTWYGNKPLTVLVGAHLGLTFELPR